MSPTASSSCAKAPVHHTALRRAALTAAVALFMTGLRWPLAHAQSDAISRPSELSVAASVEVPAAALSALAEGGKFVVGAVAISGGVAAITVSAAGLGTSFVVYISVEALKAGAIAVGKALEAVAVSGGWLLYAGSEAVCFVADEATRSQLHSREIGI
jgi:hypothetical protein